MGLSAWLSLALFPWVHPVVCLSVYVGLIPLSISLSKIRIQPAVETEALSVYFCMCSGMWVSERVNALVPAETLAVTPRLHLLLIHTLLCQATRSLALCSDGCGGEGKSWHDVFFVWEGGPSRHAPHTQTFEAVLVKTSHRCNGIHVQKNYLLYT